MLSIPPFKYAPDEIQNSISLPLMNKEDLWGYRGRTPNLVSLVIRKYSALTLILYISAPFLKMVSAPDEKNLGHAFEF